MNDIANNRWWITKVRKRLRRKGIRCKLAKAGFLKVEVDLHSYSGESQDPKELRRSDKLETNKVNESKKSEHTSEIRKVDFAYITIKTKFNVI